MKKAFAEKSGEVPMKVQILGDDVFVASLLPGKKISSTAVGSVADGKLGAAVTLGTPAAVEKVSEVAKAGAVVSWREDSGRTLKIAPVGRLLTVTTVALPKDVVDATVMAEGSVVVVQFRSVDSTWAEVYQLDDKMVLNKAYSLDPKDTTESTFSISNTDAGSYVVWTLPTGETTLYSALAPSVLATYPAGATPLNAGALSGAITEVVPRSDGSSYALRTFLTSNTAGFRGDSHLIRNGEVAWTRTESLASIIATTWVELLDPSTEEIVEDLDVETHTNVAAAYVHRVKRHVHELIQYGPAWAEALPLRIYGAFLNLQTADDERTGRWRDFFGFRKYAVVVTAHGGMAAIDVGRKGEVAWKTSLVAAGETFHGIASISEIRKGVLGIVELSGNYLEYDAFEGVQIHREELGHAVRNTAIVDTPDGKAIVALLADGSAIVLPRSMSLSAPVYLVVRNPDRGSVEGLQVSPSLSTATTWTFLPPALESVTSLTARPPHDPVASIGRVLGDRSVMYKYLTPHLLAIATSSPRLSTASIYILDAVSGSILHSATHAGVDTTHPLVATLSENWLVYAYLGDTDLLSTDAAKGHHLVVAELYESPAADDRGALGAAANVSSLALAGRTKPHVFAQSYVFPAPVASFSVTATKQGITAHEVLAAVPHGVYAVPKRLLDPRRPVGRDPTPAEAEEGLFTYAPVIEIDPRQLITHARPVLGLSRVETSPSMLESTSLVLAYGLDLFGTRVAPSMAFDILGKGFGKIQLVLTVLALAGGCGVVAPMVRRRQINARWSG
ncbi:hypothetical protein EDC01DRAFT_654680 [Geopyxis carbonaria]|nr:hypothetical protein EDC01DRAFT_654680 [Geopyxis carbonaria]